MAARPGLGWLDWIERRTWVLGLLLAAATLALYYPVHHHPFVNYDDSIYVTENPHVQSGLDWDTVKWAFTTYDAGNWHPLTWLSHTLDCQLFELNPAGHHDINLLLHVLNVLLLFWVLQQATGFAGRSFMVAALFALHPINVQTVAWVAERKNLLSMLFFLLALGAYRWYVRGPRVGRYAVVALLFALGLMAKPQVITLPCVLLLWDYWPLGRMFASTPEPLSGGVSPITPSKSFYLLVEERFPLFAIAGVNAFITMQAQGRGGARNYFPRLIRLENAIVSYAQYVKKMLWPSRLALFYPHPDSFKTWAVLAAIVLLLAITALVFLQRRRRYLVVGWLWFVGTLVPMIGLIQVGVQAMADRYAYLPFIGLFIMICWGVADWSERRHLPRALLASVSVVVLIVLTALTYRQVGYWNDGLTLWSHTLQVTTNNVVAEDDLAQALMEAGQPEEGVKHFQAALAINPSDQDGNLQIAQYDHQHGHLREALERYDKMLSITEDSSNRAVLFSNRGFVYRDLGDYVRARESFEAAMALNPRNFRTWIGLGVVTQKMGDLSLSIQDYSHANQIHPSDIGYLLL